MDEYISREALSDHVMEYGRPISCCVVTDQSRVRFEIGNWVCDGKIYFVVKADGKVGECMEISAKAPAADVVEVVRCKDCDLWNEWDSVGRRELGNYVCSCAKWTTEDGCVVFTKPNDFCSYGERKDGAE